MHCHVVLVNVIKRPMGSSKNAADALSWRGKQGFQLNYETTAEQEKRESGCKANMNKDGIAKVNITKGCMFVSLMQNKTNEN